MASLLPPDPHETMRRWLPHLLLIALLLVGLWLLAVVFKPVLEPILLAAALALLTTHALFVPIDSGLSKLMPKLAVPLRRQVSGVLATIALVGVVLLPVFILIASLVGSVSGVIDLGFGLATKSPDALTVLQQRVGEQVDRLHAIYPSLELPDRQIPEFVITSIKEATAFGPAAISFFFKGTGMLAQIVLALITLAFLYPQGTELVKGLLAYSPLDPEQRDRLFRRHRQVVLRLLNDTVAISFVKGLGFGILITVVDQTVGTGALPVIPIAFLAMIITLLPLVGSTMVWLPLALGLYATYPLAAVLIAVGSVALNIGLGRLRHMVGKRIDDRSNWMGFLLFLGLIGGLLSFGLKGFIIGPMAVVLVYTLGSFWLPLYGVGPAQSDTQLLQPAKGASDD